MTPKALSDFYIASCTENGGSYKFRLYEDGEVEEIQKILMPSPMFLQLNGYELWAVLRYPFKNSKESGFAAYDLRSGERLTEIQSTKGEVSCHIAVDGKDVYCANYTSGSVFASPDTLSVHHGHGIDPNRQKSPHPHSVVFSQDKQFVLSCDLGLDAIFVYDRRLNEISRAYVPAGAGARHIVFSKDEKYLYCINEMGGSISIFSWNAPRLALLDTVSIMPRQYREIGAGAAIKISKDGTHLYATERSSGSIVTLRADGKCLTVSAHTDCHGKEPRDFTLLANDRFAVCTNQFSNNFSMFRIGDDGIPQYFKSINFDAPVSAIEI